MLVTITLTALASLLLAAPVLFTLGHRLRWSSTAGSAVAVGVWAVAVGELTGRVLELPSRHVIVAEVILVAAALVVIRARPLWNPIGHVFFTAAVVLSVSYLTLAAKATFAAGVSMAAMAASALLLLLELFALTISVTFAFESIDVGCRTRWKREDPSWDAGFRPFVSLHVPAYNEPPDMLIETISSLEALDYDEFEIVVVDNNTEDEAVWRPVEAYCANRRRVTFVHVSPWPGYKSGALNLVLREHTSARAEIVGVVDADYVVDPSYLSALVGYFVDPTMAFVQTPQDYREYEGDTYLTACYDAYKYFFETAMPSRNDRNSIIFGGTMGLIRRSVLEGLDGWDEWCITEDAESSLRMLRAGHRGLYVNESYGKGIMPLTFSSLRRQRFRWCFGGVQILRKHWRSLMPWNRDPANHLSRAQRFDYLFGGLQWFGDLAGLAFTALLLISFVLLALTGGVALRALTGALVLIPVALIGAGLLRALWALRVLTRIGARRAILAFLTWTSLSWTTALAAMRGLVRRDGVFLRTPKWHRGGHIIEALRETRVETALGVGLGGLAGLAVVSGRWLLASLAAWQAIVFGSSPYMAWLNQRTELSARLARRARSEERRERVTAMAPLAVRTAGVGAVLAALALVTLLLIGGSDASTDQAHVFRKPSREANDRGPLGNLGVLPSGRSGPASAPAATPGTTAPVSATEPAEPDATTGGPATTPAPASTSVSTTTTSTPPTSTTTTSIPGSTSSSRPGATPTTSSPPTSSTPPSSGPPTSRPSRP
jgi:cellulose synthase/poly-beta-1,6-N-acetylglucosamine synthase-like glycosyltransferase